MAAISSSGEWMEMLIPLRCAALAEPQRGGAGAAVGPQNNEKRPLTLTDVERRLRRSGVAFADYWQRVATLKSDVVVELEHRRGCWPVLIISRKCRLTCRNADSARWSTLTDFGLERISCGIPAESQAAPGQSASV